MTGQPDAGTRVTFVLPSLTAGGAERVLITLMNGLDRTSFAPALVVVNGGGPLRDLVAADIPVTTLYDGKPPVPPERAVPALRRALRACTPDIVVSTMAPMNFAVLLLRPLFPRTRFIVREAITPSFILEKRKRAAPLIAACYRLLYPMAARVISPARMIIDEFETLLGMDTARHICLPNPVNVKALRGDGAAMPGAAPAGAVRFVASGRLHAQKGFDRLLDILPDMPGPWHLTILGEGEERQALTAQIDRLGLTARVSMPGLVARPWPYVAAADAFLLPSRWEGLPNVALESLACGTQVIAMNEAGGIAEIAAAAAPGAVTTCASMDDFAAAMKCVTAQGKDRYTASMLPALYDQDAVIAAFTQILRRVAVPPA